MHQPDLFTRLATLAKLLAADTGIVLDDVQFARRDYLRRTPLASLDGSRRWPSIATHLPHGRSTSMCQARMAEPARCPRRVEQLLAEHYWHGICWPQFERRLAAWRSIGRRGAPLPQP
ncbi:WbqC family protein [Nonomuraea phyllanthi]|uniref:WbqC family protein n=1 Tax=Nonomuraea phyllanthi TaxID=2219224 RepID=UPI001D148876|nr:WbqC family protein [Nonomuraea phyllanthi]